MSIQLLTARAKAGPQRSDEIASAQLTDFNPYVETRHRVASGPLTAATATWYLRLIRRTTGGYGGAATNRRDRPRLVRRDPLRDDRRRSESRARCAVHAHARATGRAGGEVRRVQDLSRLSRPARRPRDRRGLDRDDVGSAHRARDRGAGGRQARLPGEADGVDGRRLPGDPRGGGDGRRAFCSSATSAASTRATGWPSRRSRGGRSVGSSR